MADQWEKAANQAEKILKKIKGDGKQ